jgi:hypothetical protein
MLLAPVFQRRLEKIRKLVFPLGDMQSFHWEIRKRCQTQFLYPS